MGKHAPRIYPNIRNYETAEYKAWSSMKGRCYRPSCAMYYRYGGRGITVCVKWLNSFNSFVADVGKRPLGNYSLGRKDNDKPYEPGNVRWETPHEQSVNKCNTRRITYKGRTMAASEWATITGISAVVISHRITKRQWPVEKALTAPMAATSNARSLVFRGATRTLQEWARIVGLKPNTLLYRIDRIGMSIEDALTVPLDDRKRH